VLCGLEVKRGKRFVEEAVGCYMYRRGRPAAGCVSLADHAHTSARAADAQDLAQVGRPRQEEGSMRKVTLLASVFLMIVAAPGAALDLPPAPKGFSWIKLPEIKGALLAPKGWHFKKEERQGTIAYFITQENIEKGGWFQTGLSLNVVPPLRSTPAKEYAAAFIAGYLQRNEPLGCWDSATGPMVTFGCQVRSKEKPPPPIIMHVLAVANTRTNRLYLYIFESPEKQWPVAWKLGEQMMDLLVLDDEF
jgi:hypothetical protein